ncbi:MAG: hypothetical protein OZSIB_1627 [Candidatus Ozemobacter sibiricus]|jgi:CRISPR-associated protein (TIGR03984 family)|uniref:Uncharacterized protein n=1 Tax=Candidatus Ozemobacter sibiricus TaxID=2268124 RepID=A0A367ZJP2_9BACT|nr:MAG: hypothetical protein OZSIB_1627 [Candidatus Ozemobacter sibiricus]
MNIHGCLLQSLETTTCAEVVRWLAGRAASPVEAAGLGWALARLDDGIAWGRRENDGGGPWVFGHMAYPEQVPSLCPEKLQEVRVFGEGGEILLWRQEDRWRGRRLTDARENASAEPWRPADERWLLRADRVLAEARQGFTLVGDGTGARQAVPLAIGADLFERRRWPLYFVIRRYFTQDALTGAVRPAVTRAIALHIEGGTA